MINFAPAPNNALLSLLTPNNPTTTAVAAQPQIPSTPQQTLGFATGNAAASPLPTFSGASANGSIFAGLMNPNTQQGQTPLTGTNPMFAQPATTAPSGSDPLGLNGLRDIEKQATDFLALVPSSSPTVVNTAGIPPTNAPRSASFAPLASQGQGSPMIVLTSDALEKLKAGQSSPEDLDLQAKIKDLESQIAKAKNTPSTDTAQKIEALEKQLAEAKSNRNDEALQARLDDAQEQIRALKRGAPIAKSTATPKPVVAQAAKSTSKTT